MKYYLTLIAPRGLESDYSDLIDKNGELEVVDACLDGTLKSNAVKVFCSYNLLTSIDAPNAVLIDCANNQLTSINAPNAEIIDCANNQLTSINAPNARYINCRNNQLKSIIAPNAEAIDCANNQLTSIDAPNAGSINCRNNQLTSIDSPNVAYLYCRNNKLKSINAPNAVLVDCANNPLSASVKDCEKKPTQYYATLTTPEGKEVDLSHMINEDGKIDVMKFGLKGSLKSNARNIECRVNKLTNIEAYDAEEVVCAFNQLRSIYAPNAMIINCDDNPLQALVEDCGKCKNQIWSQKVDNVIYTYINCDRFTLKEAIAAINKKYSGKAVADYIEKVKLSQSKAA